VDFLSIDKEDDMQLARIPIHEVKAKLDHNEPLVFLDARRTEAWQASPLKLPKALRVPPSEVEQHLTRIPYNRPIVTYCS
jgi:rhodanese-related sulfurtransferase